jgi:hypothetical protein
MVRSSMLFSFTQNYNRWGLFLHFLPRNLRQLKRTFEPYVKPRDAASRLLTCCSTSLKASPVGTSRTSIFGFYELHVPRRRLTLDCVELSLVSWCYFKSVFKICIVIFLTFSALPKSTGNSCQSCLGRNSPSSLWIAVHPKGNLMKFECAMAVGSSRHHSPFSRHRAFVLNNICERHY